MRERDLMKSHPVKQTEESFLFRSIENLKELIAKIERLNSKKNMSLYTSIIDNRFKPPVFSMSKDDVKEIIHRSSQLLIRAKQIIMKDQEVESFIIKILFWLTKKQRWVDFML